MTLRNLRKGQVARVGAICPADAELEAKLRELGFSEGDEVELMHTGPFGGGPLAFRLNRSIVALRVNEAGAIQLARGGADSAT